MTPSRLVWLAIVFWVSTACTPLISPYSQEAYKTATELKARSLALIAKSSEPYRSNVTAVEDLSIRMNAAYEYAKGRPRNSVSEQQWELMRDPNGNLMGGFLKVWKGQGKTSSFYREEKISQISEAYDTLICVEISKKEASDC
ncbi:MAG: hypothetical protein AAF393_07335 [Pseudomonadota bacterium]